MFIQSSEGKVLSANEPQTRRGERRGSGETSSQAKTKSQKVCSNCQREEKFRREFQKD
jgi:hypothetical protein